MTERKPSATLPRLRVSSHSFADFSSHNMSNLTLRTVSSSTSTISTPSNNIRRIKQEQPFVEKKNDHHKKKAKSLRPSLKPEGAKASKKLLNLQQLRKSYAPPQPFVLHKPADMSHFDYLVFTKKQKSLKEKNAMAPQSLLLPSSPAEPLKPALPPVRLSQIKAWESAESVSCNRVFEYSKQDDELWFDDDSYDFGAEEEVSIDRGTDEWNEPSSSNEAIALIPELSRSELEVVSAHFKQLEMCSGVPNLDQYEREEKKALWAHAMQQSDDYEKMYSSNHTISGKRRVQVLQKRAFLQKLFGYSNNINTELTTNNSSYSSVDSSMSAQKAFHEDKEEICELLEQQQAYQQALEEVRERLVPSGSIKLGTDKQTPGIAYLEVDQSKLVDVTSHWLSSIYDRDGDVLLEEDDDDPEIVSAAMLHLKQCVREAADETMEE